MRGHELRLFLPGLDEPYYPQPRISAIRRLEHPVYGVVLPEPGLTDGRDLVRSRVSKQRRAKRFGRRLRKPELLEKARFVPSHGMRR